MHMDKRRVSLVAKVCAQSFQSPCVRYFICMHMYVCMGPLFIFICMYVCLCILNFVNIYVCMEALKASISGRIQGKLLRKILSHMTSGENFSTTRISFYPSGKQPKQQKATIHPFNQYNSPWIFSQIITTKQQKHTNMTSQQALALPPPTSHLISTTASQ